MFSCVVASRRSPLLYNAKTTNAGTGAAAATGGKPAAAGKEQKNYGSNGNRYNEV
jgi:hypothetical protein